MKTTATTSMQDPQEFAYGDGYDYRAGEPHVKHTRLYDQIIRLIKGEVEHAAAVGLPLSVLEIGAGDGAFVEPLLATGAQVTATEMSRPSIASLQERFRRNPGFEAAFDPDGTFAPLDSRQFSCLFYASVLHHIPDYVANIRAVLAEHLAPGGSLISIQDPPWYATLPPGQHAAYEAMYLSWRVTRGEFARGVASRLRRARRSLREDLPSDMVGTT